MTIARQKLGRIAEGLAAEHLTARGYSVIDRNVRVAGVRGEIDLIALDRGALVFVEVKARSAGAVRGPETPLEMVGRRKQMKLRSLAGAWLARAEQGSLHWRSLRFDVIGITIGPGGEVVDWRHLVAAF